MYVVMYVSVFGGSRLLVGYLHQGRCWTRLGRVTSRMWSCCPSEWPQLSWVGPHEDDPADRDPVHAREIVCGGGGGARNSRLRASCWPASVSMGEDVRGGS